MMCLTYGHSAARRPFDFGGGESVCNSTLLSEVWNPQCSRIPSWWEDMAEAGGSLSLPADKQDLSE